MVDVQGCLAYTGLCVMMLDFTMTMHFNEPHELAVGVECANMPLDYAAYRSVASSPTSRGCSCEVPQCDSWRINLERSTFSTKREQRERILHQEKPFARHSGSVRYSRTIPFNCGASFVNISIVSLYNKRQSITQEKKSPCEPTHPEVILHPPSLLPNHKI